MGRIIQCGHVKGQKRNTGINPEEKHERHRTDGSVMHLPSFRTWRLCDLAVNKLEFKDQEFHKKKIETPSTVIESRAID